MKAKVFFFADNLPGTEALEALVFFSVSCIPFDFIEMWEFIVFHKRRRFKDGEVVGRDMASSDVREDAEHASSSAEANWFPILEQLFVVYHGVDVLFKVWKGNTWILFLATNDEVPFSWDQSRVHEISLFGLESTGRDYGAFAPSLIHCRCGGLVLI